ncbi:MAG: MurR/RpiR family transcriptional regulator [Peptostreptococcus sp.]|uniref:MurR/RpiR family transcriptional regulator n=1 Tax=Peptostreptococcus sp. TaxID=1262 RepID=UPI002FC99F80
MSIIGNINRPKFRPTKSDKLIMKYVLDNIDSVPYMQISSMAKNIGTGEATITRCVKKLGCNGFQEFKLGLAKEITIREQNNILDSNIKQNEPAVETASKLVSSNLKVLDETLSMLDSSKIELAAKYILKARRVCFIGIGFSGIVALDSSYKFMRIGIDCSSYDNNHMMIMMASIIREGDLVFAVSNSGETSELINTIKIAKDNGANIVSILGDEDSTLAKLSDLFISYYSDESLLEAGSMATKMSQIFIVELIYTEVVKFNIIESTNNKLRTTDAIKKLSDYK